MNGNQRKRRKLLRLFRQQAGLCHYCGCAMLSPAEYEHRNRATPPRNLCTLEHLRSRFNPERGQNPNGARFQVAACWSCNGKRGTEEQAAQPIEALHERASRHRSRYLPRGVWPPVVGHDFPGGRA